MTVVGLSKPAVEIIYLFFFYSLIHSFITIYLFHYYRFLFCCFVVVVVVAVFVVVKY